MTNGSCQSQLCQAGQACEKKAKAHIRYIQHRQGKDGERIIRTLFNNDGTMEREEAYRMIDAAGKRDVLFRLIISPDPTLED